MALKPIGQRAIAEIIEEKEIKTSGGIILSGEMEKKAVTKDVRKAVIVSSNLPDLHVGDKVLYDQYSGTPYKNYIIFDQKDTIVIVEE